MLPRHEVLRLQLFASAWREAHAKVRQSLIPRARHAHLLRTILGRKFNNGVQIPASSFRPKEFRGCVKRLPFVIAALDPKFVNTLILPVSKKADAVATRFDRVKVFFYC